MAGDCCIPEGIGYNYKSLARRDYEEDTDGKRIGEELPPPSCRQQRLVSRNLLQGLIPPCCGLIIFPQNDYSPILPLMGNCEPAGCIRPAATIPTRNWKFSEMRVTYIQTRLRRQIRTTAIFESSFRYRQTSPLACVIHLNHRVVVSYLAPSQRAVYVQSAFGTFLEAEILSHHLAVTWE
ncbi:MAG: hypothetical protein JWM11_7942 [Planctomycetaceae bacterium]|nr:hypothetical protein [Planctomycetaceae bacterium]